MAVNISRLPVDKDLPWFRFRVALTKVTYTLEMRYNTRMDRWILHILDAVGQPILMGIPLLRRRNVIGQYPTLALPPGGILAMDDSGKQLEATVSSFLIDHRLLYVERA